MLYGCIGWNNDLKETKILHSILTSNQVTNNESASQPILSKPIYDSGIINKE